MKTPTRKTATAIIKHLTILAAFASTTAAAEKGAAFPYADELESCVSAVTEHLDLSNVSRVRHTVVQEKRTGIGYALSIETSVFAGEDERRYKAYCVATGTDAPLKFTIDER